MKPKWNVWRAALFGAVISLVYTVARQLIGSGRSWSLATADDIAFTLTNVAAALFLGALLFVCAAVIRNRIAR